MSGEAFAVWTDIETTGLDVDADILEVGVRTTDADLNTIAEQSWVVPYHGVDVANMRNAAKQVVRDMHDVGRLWLACERLAGPRRFMEIADHRRAVKQEIAGWLTEHAKGLPVAGSSVRADRAWLSYWLPEVDQILHYRIIDVSSLRILAQTWRPEALAAVPTGQKRHRVMSDLDDSIELLRYLRDALDIGPISVQACAS